MVKKEGKMPNNLEPVNPHDLSLAEKVGQLFMPAAFINDSEEEITRLEQLIEKRSIGSICFFHSRASAATNFEGKKEVITNEKSYERLLYLINRYQKAAKIPLLIAIDAEWGLAMRIENTNQYPYAITLGAMQEQEELVFKVGQAIAEDCLNAGIHWNLAPVVDINLNPLNPVIGYRSFGDNKEKVTAYADAFLEGMTSVGILNSIKHFPGHGDTATDSHLGLPIIEKDKSTLLEEELYPYLKLMHKADAIMVGHLAVPALANGKKEAASISKNIMTSFLRQELGWEGLIISDALNMHALTKDHPGDGAIETLAFVGGNDVLCFADHVNDGIEKILEKATESRINESFNRFWDLKQKSFVAKGKTKDTSQGYEVLMHQIAQESLTLLQGSTADITVFREGGYQFLQIGKPDGVFREALDHNQPTNKATLLSIFPRQVKPKNHFGFTKEELATIKEVLSQHPTIIYLFGNPFVLNLLPWSKAVAVVVVYQDFEVFQKNAVAHFNGIQAAKGKLPIQLQNHGG